MNTSVVNQQASRIVLVDDMVTNLHLLAAALKDQYRLSAATNGPDAIALIERLQPDLVLLDVEMPGMSGHEVCRRLKRNPQTQHIPLIFITGRSSEADEVLGLQLGAVDYLTKPFNQAIVQARVHTHLELKRYHDLLQQHAYLDGLTGLPNRRRLHDYLEQTWQSDPQRTGTVAVLMMDIDHFKAFNDGNGHRAGDQCLRQVAASLAEARRRSSDLLARYGGEEFICVMPGGSQEIGLDQAERFRQSVIEQQIPYAIADFPEHVSISVGVADGLLAQTSPESLIERADRALYEAKHGGRNRVCSA